MVIQTFVATGPPGSAAPQCGPHYKCRTGVRRSQRYHCVSVPHSVHHLSVTVGRNKRSLRSVSGIPGHAGNGRRWRPYSGLRCCCCTPTGADFHPRGCPFLQGMTSWYPIDKSAFPCKIPSRTAFPPAINLLICQFDPTKIHLLTPLLNSTLSDLSQ